MLSPEYLADTRVNWRFIVSDNNRKNKPFCVKTSCRCTNGSHDIEIEERVVVKNDNYWLYTVLLVFLKKEAVSVLEFLRNSPFLIFLLKGFTLLKT